LPVRGRRAWPPALGGTERRPGRTGRGPGTPPGRASGAGPEGAVTGTIAPSRGAVPVRPARTSRRAPLVVWSTWALMLAGALWFLGRYGSNVPSWDGWDMVPTLTGHQPVTLDWLWSQHNEHRVPVPRLLLLGL